MATQAKQAAQKKKTKKKTAIKDARSVATRRRSRAAAAGAKTAKASRTAAGGPQLSILADTIMLTLHNEHKYISTLQDALERQTKQLAPGGRPDYHILRDMVDYMSHYPEEFHHRLEDLIYHRLVERHHSSIGDVEELLSQHQDMARDTKYLLQQLNGICSGKTKPLRNQLRQDLQSYVEFYRSHINLEEGVVFPAAKQHLQEADWRDVNKSLHIVEDPLFSESPSSKYNKLADYINEKSEDLIAEFALAELFGIEAMIESVQAGFDGLAELREVCRRHVRNRLQKNLDALQQSREQGMAALLSLPAQLINDSIADGGQTLREIARVCSATWDGATDPFAVRAEYFRAMMDNKQHQQAR